MNLIPGRKYKTIMGTELQFLRYEKNKKNRTIVFKVVESGIIVKCKEDNINSYNLIEND